MDSRGFDLDRRLAALEEQRELQPVDRVDARSYFCGPTAGELPVMDGTETLVFGSHDYLGLARDVNVQDAARQAAATVGTGAGSSRIEAGDTLVHHDLERSLAESLGGQRTLVFPTAWMAAFGVLSALAPDVVFIDVGAHPRLHHAARFCESTVVPYAHADADALSRRLDDRAEERPSVEESWLVVTDSCFEYDGRVAPLSAICDVTETHGAWTLVDESNAIGLYANAGGIVRTESLDDRIDVQLGSLSHALASQGGYVLGDTALVECLLNCTDVFGCSVGVSPPAAATASEALHRARHGEYRERLWDNVAHVREGLETLGIAVSGETQHFSIPTDGSATARRLAARLLEKGVYAPPTPLWRGFEARDGEETDVDVGLRITPTAAHTRADVVECLEAVKSTLATAEIADSRTDEWAL